MTSERESLVEGRPLHVRLRDEAAEWDEGEDIVPLLLEAAEVIEGIGGAVAQAAVIGAKYATRAAPGAWDIPSNASADDTKSGCRDR